MAGMLSHLVAAGNGLSITLLHADADESSFALRRQVARLKVEFTSGKRY